MFAQSPAVTVAAVAARLDSQASPQMFVAQA
jgi:hypothetical protein